jgi:hypothetical protein
MPATQKYVLLQGIQTGCYDFLPQNSPQNIINGEQNKTNMTGFDLERIVLTIFALR